jgi:TP901-1 family phage major tail protein
MAIIAGKNLRLFVDIAEDEFTAIGNATNCSLQIGVSTITTRHKDSTGNFVSKEPDEISGTLTTESFLDDTDDAWDFLSDAVLEGTIVPWQFTTGEELEHIYSGNGYLTSFEEAAPIDGKATYSVTIETTGEIELDVVPEVE